MRERPAVPQGNYISLDGKILQKFHILMGKPRNFYVLVSNATLKSHKTLLEISKALCQSRQDSSNVPSMPISPCVHILPVPWHVQVDRRLSLEAYLGVTGTQDA